jgi:hypothetical protein
MVLLSVCASAKAQDHSADAFAGTVGTTFIRVGIHVIDDTSGEVSGISIRPAGNGSCDDLRLLVGTSRGNHLQLSEYTRDEKKTATISGQVETGHLRGQWHMAEGASIDFDLSDVDS